MKAISNFFNAYDAKLTSILSYFNNRVLTGKFIQDINHQIILFVHLSIKITKKIHEILIHSKTLAIMLRPIYKIWQFLLTIPLFNIIISFIIEAIRILIKCYSEIFIVFAMTFSLTIFLLDVFQTAIVTFCFLLIPILLINVVCISALYYCIEIRESEGKITIWQSFLFVFRHIRSLCFPAIIEFATILESFLIFVMTLLLFTYVFDFLHLYWSGSVLYWLIFIAVSIVTVIGLFAISILLPQVYFSVLLDHLSFYDAFIQAKKYIKHALLYFIFFYALFYMLCIAIIWHASLSSLYLGFTTGMYFSIAFGTFLAFFLKKRFSDIPPKNTLQSVSHKLYLTLNIIIIFGFINYILLSLLLIKEYQPLKMFISNQYENYLNSLDMQLYTNTAYGYSLSYPQNWSFYQWQPNSVTFYNNYTRTLAGGTWMTITVSPYTGSIFDNIYNASPGTVENVQQKNIIVTKVTDMTIQNYPTVNYLYTKRGIPYTNYEAHYLIHKGSNTYDVSFTSVTNDIGSYNDTLFTKIINSFTFIQ